MLRRICGSLRYTQAARFQGPLKPLATTQRASIHTPHHAGCACCSPQSPSLPSGQSQKPLVPSSTAAVSGSARQSSSHPFSIDHSLASDDYSHESEHVKTLLNNNRRWVKESNERDPDFFKKLSQPQAPKYLYFGCSDSRVPANQIMGLGPGEVFVHRNIGNQVPGNDLNALSVIEFAVGHVGVTDIIVTGHYDCGAVRAALARQDLGTLENWLRLIRDVYRLHKDYLDLVKDPDQRHHTLVELNVIEQCLNVFKTGIVQRKRIQTREALIQAGKSKSEIRDGIYPRVHGMVFNPADGLLKKLTVDFHRKLGSLDHIYGLYEPKKKT